MSIASVVTQSVVPAGSAALAVSRQDNYSSTEALEIDYPIPAGSTAQAINVGIADTAKIKAIILTNIGTADITALTLDSGSVDLPLKANESFTLSGAGICKALIDAWAGAATMLVLKATTPAGPATARLKGLIIVDAA